ncbi:MAG: hypothetical protein ABIH50_03670 [bacterium]
MSGSTGSAIARGKVWVLLLLILALVEGWGYGLPARGEGVNREMVHGYFFTSPGCEKCAAVDRLILRLAQKYPLEFRRLDINDPANYALLVKLEEKYQTTCPESPVIFIRDRLLSGKKEISDKLEAEIAKGAAPWPEAGLRGINSEQKIKERFHSFDLLVVGAAGLVDGINPCAFATIVFFISFLGFIGRRKREILLAGSFFSVAVFITYLLIGLGAFNFLRSLGSFSWLSRSVYYAVGGLAIVFGCISLYDYYRVRVGRGEGIILRLPLGIQKAIHSVIRANATSKRIAAAALVTGFSVTLLEVVCTGQLYLPTIVWLVKAPGFEPKALGYLVFYNLMFILPLVIVFILTYFGVASDRFGRLMKGRLGMIKLLAAALFFSLGVLLLFR